MKRKVTKVAAAATLLGVSVLGHAQSSVTLFGLIDTGITYVSNQGGHSNVRMDDGINSPDLWGIQGVEDLGGGTKAVFNLTNQFSVDNGSFLPGQSIFSRNAYVGLTNVQYGALTLGNQYDFMVDSLYSSRDDPAIYAGHLYGQASGPYQKLALPGNATGDFDWYRAAGRITNSVKYVSPVIAGFSVGAMYGFGGVPGSVGTGDASSFALNYASGGFGANAAYTFVKTPATAGVIGPQVSVRNWGAGTRYQWRTVGVSALFVTVRNTANNAYVYEASFGTNWLVRPDLSLGASYFYSKGNEVVTNNHAHQAALIAEYFLSKRSSVYVMSVYERANSGAQALINGFTGTTAASSGQNQFLARVGVRTRF